MHKGKFDPLIHAQNRLQICAILASTAEMEFKAMKERLQVSDSVLSKHLKSLQDAEYVALNKRTEFGRPRTWLSLSAKGRKAYGGHLQALQEIVGNI